MRAALKQHKGVAIPNRQGLYHKGQVDDCAWQVVVNGRWTVQWELFLAPCQWCY